MSGVRIYNKRLLDLGLTLPGFVERGKTIAGLPSLGLLTLAAHTPADWEIAYQELDDLPADAGIQIAQEGFSIVAISALTARVQDAYRLADQLRKAGITVIIGGLHASALPGEAAAHADIVVRGEGELVWKQVLADWEAGRARRIYDARLFNDRTDPFRSPELPIPRYDLLDLGQYNRITLQTTRGCPLDCSFCAASRLISPYRKKPPAQIRRELEAILDRWNRPFIELADDNTFVDKAWSRQLVEVFTDYPIKWFTETDISLADDRKLLEQLSTSGCAQVLIGLESANAASLNSLDTRHWKARRSQNVRDRIRIIQNHGITVNGCFVVGFEEDDMNGFSQTLDYIDSLELAEVQVTVLTPFPGTRLRQQLEYENRILPTVTWSHYTLFDVTYRPARLSVSELEAGFAWLISEVYSKQRVRHRQSIIKDCLAARTPS